MKPSVHWPPPSKLRVTVTYVEMTEAPSRPLAPDPPAAGVTVTAAIRPTVSFYRFLYNTVGRDWLWTERRAWSDEALAAIVLDPHVEISILQVAGSPAGFAELDLRSAPDIELVYFGLIPEFIGQGLGRFFLDWTIARAWSHDASRFWLHTCSLDHPRALSLYQKAGFRPYKNETILRDDPRGQGLI